MTERKRFSGANFDLVVLAASMGGIEALPRVLGSLPASFPVPIALVQHIAAPSCLPELLAQRTALSVAWASPGARLRPGTVYVAPPAYHFSVTADYRCSLGEAEKANYVRPAADVLFRSAAQSCPGRTLGVVLTGLGRDAAEGARAIKWYGGSVIAQDRATSREFSMPNAAIEAGSVDFVLPLPAIASALVALVTVPGIGALFPVASAA
jgi:two-component system chemotaxis response regulator CheB